MITSIWRSQSSSIAKVIFCSLMFWLGMMLSQWDKIFWSLTLPHICNLYCWFLIKHFQEQGKSLKASQGFLLLDLEYFAGLTKVCVALHNYLMTKKNFGETNSYCPNGFLDQDVWRNGEWRETRCKSFLEITFTSPNGAVPWQLDMVSVSMSK